MVVMLILFFIVFLVVSLFSSCSSCCPPFFWLLADIWRMGIVGGKKEIYSRQNFPFGLCNSGGIRYLFVSFLQGSRFVVLCIS